MKRKVNRRINKDNSARPVRRYMYWLGRLIVLSVILFGVVFGVIRITDPATLPIKSVQVEGTFKYLEVAQMQEAVSRYSGSGFFDLDIGNIQKTVRGMSWVDQVSVRRIWPDTVRIRINEHVPLARWEGNGLVNIRGEWFDAKQDATVKILPEFSGPEGSSKTLTDQYHEIRKVLEPAGLSIAKLKMNQRRTWSVTLENGIDIELGKSGIIPRLNRFVRVYPMLLEQLSTGLSLQGGELPGSLNSKVDGIDLRYTNGFSIHWQRELKNSGLRGPDLQKAGLMNRGIDKHV